MTDQHPITPSPELFTEWLSEALLQSDAKPTSGDVGALVAAKSAQWGADQELEACCEWLDSQHHSATWSSRIRAARRPKPPSLTEQALGALGRFNSNAHTRADEMTQDFDTIRRALEALDD